MDKQLKHILYRFGLLWSLGLAFLCGPRTYQILQAVMNAQSTTATLTPVFVTNSQDPSSEDNAVGTATNNSCVNNAFCGHFAQPTLAGNTLVVAYTYKAASGNTPNVPTVTDDASNVYTCVTEANDSTTSRYVGACYSLGKNGGSGSVPTVSAFAFTVTWTAGVSYPQADGWQGYNIDSFDKSAVGNGTAATTFTTAALTGLIANDMVVHIVKVTSPAATSTTGSTVGVFTVGSNWSLRAADQRDGLAVQDRVFTAGGSLTPSMTNAVSSSYASLALAFKASAVGSPQGVAPSGFYIACKYSYNTQTSPNLTTGATSSVAMQMPCGTIGNELVVGMSGGSTGADKAHMIHVSGNTGSYTLSECGTYNFAGGVSYSDMWYAANITGDNSGALTMTTNNANSPSGDISFWSYVLAGAAPQGCTGFNIPGATFTMSAGTWPYSITNGPGVAASLTYQPQNSNGITILAEQQTNNTIISLNSPCTNGFDVALQGAMVAGGPWVSDENNTRAHCFQSGSTANATQDWQITGGGSASTNFLGGGTFNLASFPAATAVYPVQLISQQDQTAQVGTCAATTCELASITTKTANDPLVVYVGSFNSTGRTVSKVCLDGNATCSTGTQFVQATNAAVGQSGNGVDVWYLIGATVSVAAHNVIAVYSGTASSREMAVWELPATITAFDLANHNNCASSCTTTVKAPAAALTTTGTQGFCIAGTGVATGVDGGGANVGNPTTGNEFTAGSILFTNTGDGAVSLVSTTAGSHQAQWTLTSAGTWASTIGCFK